MKALLALALTAWLGAGGGAAFDNTIPAFWAAWALAGIVLVVLTAHERTRRNPPCP